jgi:hypothetical protein
MATARRARASTYDHRHLLVPLQYVRHDANMQYCIPKVNTANALLHLLIGWAKVTIWQFMDYVTEDGKCPIADWYQAQGQEVQVAFDQIAYALRRIRDWGRRWQIKPLKKEHAGLWQVRFKIGEKDKEIKYRPVRIVTRDARLSAVGQFVFLLGCQKQLGQYSPPTAFADALDLKRQFDAGKGRLNDHFESLDEISILEIPTRLC